MNSKEEKIKSILAIASGKAHSVIKAHPSLDFRLVDKDRKLFRCEQTGEELTWLQIQQEIIVDMDRFWGTCGIADGEDFYIGSIFIMSVGENKIFFPGKPLEYHESIQLDLNDYVDQGQTNF